MRNSDLPEGPAPEPRTTAWLALGCAVSSMVLSLSMCGAFALTRTYREFTAPLTILLGAAAVILGWIAYRRFARPRP